MYSVVLHLFPIDLASPKLCTHYTSSSRSNGYNCAVSESAGIAGRESPLQSPGQHAWSRIDVVNNSNGSRGGPSPIYANADRMPNWGMEHRRQFTRKQSVVGKEATRLWGRPLPDALWDRGQRHSGQPFVDTGNGEMLLFSSNRVKKYIQKYCILPC